MQLKTKPDMRDKKSKIPCFGLIPLRANSAASQMCSKDKCFASDLFAPAVFRPGFVKRTAAEKTILTLNYVMLIMQERGKGLVQHSFIFCQWLHT